MSFEPDVWLVRHGETEWSRDGRHTGRTDLPLTEAGKRQAEALRPFLEGVHPDLVLCSPRTRARRSAELAGFLRYEVDEDLQEWDYGDFEGLTTAAIQEALPGWSIWAGPWKGGETASEVARRADRLISRIVGSGAERVLLVGHGHFGRVLAARWVGEEVGTGRWLVLGTATWSLLGWDRGARVLVHWNVPVASQD